MKTSNLTKKNMFSRSGEKENKQMKAIALTVPKGVASYM
jgi:hypothetical protein